MAEHVLSSTKQNCGTEGEIRVRFSLRKDFITIIIISFSQEIFYVTNYSKKISVIKLVIVCQHMYVIN